MKTFSPHIDFAKLLDIAENRANDEGQKAAGQHLKSCEACSEKLGEVSRVLALMRSDDSVDAPRDVLAYARNLYNAAAFSRPSVLRKIVAALTFDSADKLTPAFGVRSGQTDARQLLYSAENSDIDLRITAQDDRCVITGQLLGADCAPAEAEIEGSSATAKVELNELCEFVFPPIPAGSYTLRLHFSNSEVEIRELDIRV